MSIVRVAAVQYAVTEEVDDNLATALRMTDQAAAEGAQVVVLPEFCNHVSWYADRDHARRMALTLDSPFVKALSAKAAEHSLMLMANCTLAREDGRTTGSNILFGADGTILAVTDKQVLMGSERDHLDPAIEASPILDTPVGRVGLYSCMDGVINETPRMLAVGGAQLLLNSINSFALDEATLHVPVRAVENKVWVVASNKVGPLVPPHSIAMVAERVGRTRRAAARGGGGPDRGSRRHRGGHRTPHRRGRRGGRHRRRAGRRQAPSRRHRRDGVASPRPVRADPRRPARAAAPRGCRGDWSRPSSARRTTTTWAPCCVRRWRRAPRWSCSPSWPSSPRTTSSRPWPAPRPSSRPAWPTATPTSAWCWAPAGIVLRQPQLHACARLDWASTLGDGLQVVDLPWGRLALVVGDDALYPETFRLAAFQDVDVVAVPFTTQTPADLDPLLLERAAENRINVAVASRRGAAGGGALFPLSADFTLWAPDRRPVRRHHQPARPGPRDRLGAGRHAASGVRDEPLREQGHRPRRRSSLGDRGRAGRSRRRLSAAVGRRPGVRAWLPSGSGLAQAHHGMQASLRIHGVPVVGGAN